MRTYLFGGLVTSSHSLFQALHFPQAGMSTHMPVHSLPEDLVADAEAAIEKERRPANAGDASDSDLDEPNGDRDVRIPQLLNVAQPAMQNRPRLGNAVNRPWRAARNSAGSY